MRDGGGAGGGGGGPRSGGDDAPGPGEPVPGGAFRRFEIDAKTHPNAVCNDGTVPVFYLSRGSESDKWVIWFKGGAACGDEASCRARSPALSSSTPWRRIDTLGDKSNPDTSEDGKAGGILSSSASVNPDFHAWNRVYVVYCSSDEWIGTRKASPESFGMHFEGRNIALAIVDALKDGAAVGRPTLEEGTKVILAGSSAGGNGVRANIDLLASKLGGMDVKGFADAGITPEVTPVRGAGGEEGKKARLALWQGEGDASCVAALGASEAWRCSEGITLVTGGHISTPTFHHQDQRDPKIMGSRSDRSADPAVARETAEEIRDAMRGLSGAFCPAFGNHILANDDKFTNLRVDGVSAADLFGNWYFGRSGPKVLIVEGPSAEQQGRGGRHEGREQGHGAKRQRNE